MAQEEKEIKHADPVFNDLTTSLGADKGEKELNINGGYRKLGQNHHILLSQLEYEFAPVDNLGIGFLLPYTSYFTNQQALVERPPNRMEFFQWALQYTLYQSYERNFSLALSFQNTIEIPHPEQRKSDFSLEEIRYFPFLIAAKNWQERYFALVSLGPSLAHDLAEHSLESNLQMTTALHYRWGEKDHFIGAEFNKEMDEGELELYIRPQLILDLSDTFTLGSTIGIPVNIQDEEWMAFVRLAVEF